MKTASATALNWVPYPGQRSLHTKYKPLLQGIAGVPDNFEMYLICYGEGGSHSPRHRHNFDQFRWAFDMPLNFAIGGDIPPGHLGYFPEGMYYGPQTNLEGTQMLIVQFGGVSGSGYMTNEALRQGTLELRAKGEFIRGVYTSSDETGKRFNKDAYEAVWEHMAGRRLEYPPARLSTPIVIDPEAFSWLPVGEGVAKRPLEIFNERGTAAFQFRLLADAWHELHVEPATRLLYVLSGNLLIEDVPYPTGSAIGLYNGEGAMITASEETLILGFTMPNFEA
jgi:hypothetical protein